MAMQLYKIAEKRLTEIQERVQSRAWDAVLSGSEEKLKEDLKLVEKVIRETRAYLIREEALIPDSELVPVKDWPKDHEKGINNVFENKPVKGRGGQAALAKCSGCLFTSINNHPEEEAVICALAELVCNQAWKEADFDKKRQVCKYHPNKEKFSFFDPEQIKDYFKDKKTNNLKTVLGDLSRAGTSHPDSIEPADKKAKATVEAILNIIENPNKKEEKKAE